MFQTIFSFSIRDGREKYTKITWPVEILNHIHLLDKLYPSNYRWRESNQGTIVLCNEFIDPSTYQLILTYSFLPTHL